MITIHLNTGVFLQDLTPYQAYEELLAHTGQSVHVFEGKVWGGGHGCHLPENLWGSIEGVPGEDEDYFNEAYNEYVSCRLQDAAAS